MNLLIASVLLFILIIYETIIFFNDYRKSDKSAGKKIQLTVKIMSLFIMGYIIVQAALAIYTI